MKESRAMTRSARLGNWWGPYISVSPLYLKITIAAENTPFVQPIAGRTAPATTTISYVRVIYAPGVLDAQITNGGKDITLTILKMAAFPYNLPIVVTYTVTAPTGGSGIGFIQVNAPKALPPTAATNPITAGPADLGIPYVVSSSDVLTQGGWTDPQGYQLGMIALKPIVWGRGITLPVALTPGNWTSLPEIADKRIELSTYSCLLIDLRNMAGTPTARNPSCLTSVSGIQFTVANSRYATAQAKVNIPVATAAVYPAPFLGKDGTVSRAWSTALGFTVERYPDLTTGAPVYASGIAASVNPAAASSTNKTLTFAASDAGDGSYASEVTLDFSASAAPVTLFGATSAITGGKGTILMTLTLTDGSTTKDVPYYLVAPFPLKDAKVYGGAALFGTGWSISQAVIKAARMPAGATLTLSEFDVSSTSRPYPTLV